MPVVSQIVLILCGLAMLACAFMLVRVQWVYRARMAFHAECFDQISTAEWYAYGQPGPDDLCVSHTEMMLRFWIWDREKFRTRRLPASLNQHKAV